MQPQPKRTRQETSPDAGQTAAGQGFLANSAVRIECIVVDQNIKLGCMSIWSRTRPLLAQLNATMPSFDVGTANLEMDGDHRIISETNATIQGTFGACTNPFAAKAALQ